MDFTRISLNPDWHLLFKSDMTASDNKRILTELLEISSSDENSDEPNLPDHYSEADVLLLKDLSTYVSYVKIHQKICCWKKICLKMIKWNPTQKWEKISIIMSFLVCKKGWKNYQKFWVENLFVVLKDCATILFSFLARKILY